MGSFFCPAGQLTEPGQSCQMGFWATVCRVGTSGDMAESAKRTGEELSWIDEVIPAFTDPEAHLARLRTTRNSVRQENNKPAGKQE
jgi:hypothetical protein